jgi:hypothetical protein
MPSIVGDAGLVFEYGNAAELAEKIQQLFEDTELARGMARRGHARVLERYTWDKIATTARQAYLSVRAKARRMRVLICSNLFPPHTAGGAEIVLTRKLLSSDLGVDVEVFVGADGHVDHLYGVTANGNLKKPR